jgi:hypothetical protein
VRRTLAALVLVAAAASIPGAAAGRGIGLSASPLRLNLRGASVAAITVRNPGRSPMLLDVSRAGFARSLRGRPRVRPAGRATNWLRLSAKRIRIAAGGRTVLHVRAAPPRRAAAGDHPALVLLTTRPHGARHVRVRVRIGVIVVLHIPGRIVHSLDPRALEVRHRGVLRLLELRIVNRGNVTERLGGGRLRLALLRQGRTFVTLRPRQLELLPHSMGIAEFVYRGRVRGTVAARVELRPPLRSHLRAFWIRL